MDTILDNKLPKKMDDSKSVNNKSCFPSLIFLGKKKLDEFSLGL